MARGGGQIGYAPRDNTPQNNTLQQLIQGLAQVSQSYFQTKAQEDALRIEKERFALQEKMMKAEMERAEAKDSAALQIMQNDPSMRQFMGGGAASTLQPPPLQHPPGVAAGGGPPQHAVPGAMAGGAAPMGPAPSLAPPVQQGPPPPPRGAPMQSQTGQPIRPVAPGGRMTPQIAGAMLPQLQEHMKVQASLAESKARVGQAEAATALSHIEARLGNKKLAVFDELHNAEMAHRNALTEQALSGAEANRESAATSRASRVQMDRDRDQKLNAGAVQIVQDKMSRYGQLARDIGPAAAAELVFGSRKVPSHKELMTQAKADLTGVAPNATDGRTVLEGYEAQDRTAYAGRLGIDEQTLQIVDTSLEQYKSAKEAAKAALAAGLPKEQRRAIYLYLKYVTGEDKLKPEDIFQGNELGWFRSVVRQSQDVTAGQRFQRSGR